MFDCQGNNNTIILYNSVTWTLKEEQKRKLRVFEMSVLRKHFGAQSPITHSCRITRDRRRNSDVMKELAIEEDTIQVLQTRRLTLL